MYVAVNPQKDVDNAPNCSTCKRGVPIWFRIDARVYRDVPVLISREFVSVLYGNRDLVIQHCPTCLALARGFH